MEQSEAVVRKEDAVSRHFAWLGFLLVFFTFGASGASYPERPVRLVAAQSAGSSLDTITRIVAPRMSELLGQQLVIDNRGGAGGIIGVEMAARASPDGYTLLVGAPSSMILSRFTYSKLAFDSAKDFDAVSLTVNAESVMVTHPSVPVGTVKEFIALARAKPRSLNMGSAGVGASSHLAGIMFTVLTDIDVIHVPYKGGGPMATAIVAGESQWAISPAAALMGHIKAGRMKALAISSAMRSPLMPELPTIAEAGVPGYEYTSWNGIFVPKGTPRAVVTKLHSVTQQALADAQVRKLYANQGLAPLGSASPEEFGKFFQADFARMARLAKVAGLKPE
jgi:tripartite-type tricarboxylate transporter receptor subunit TctC